MQLIRKKPIQLLNYYFSAYYKLEFVKKSKYENA